jgi:predicted RNase H-like HicB family nuclease
MRKYTVLVHEAEEGGYWAEVQELPGCFASADTLEELEDDAMEAIKTYIEASRLMEVTVPESPKSVKLVHERELRTNESAVARELERVGLSTTEDLLESAGSPSGRAGLARKTGLSEKLILEWVNRADLMRIKGIRTDFSDLLEAAGVDSVQELSTRSPASLHSSLETINTSEKLARRTPSFAEVAKWIAEARTIKSMVTH